MNTSNHIEERLIQFTADAYSIADELPKSFTGKHLSKKLIRPVLAASMTYGEILSEQSSFHLDKKLRDLLKNLRRSEICLKIIAAKALVEEREMDAILLLCTEVVTAVRTEIEKLDNN